MSHVSIINKLLSNLKPTIKPYFLRDSNLKGFSIKGKSNCSGSGKMTAYPGSVTV